MAEAKTYEIALLGRGLARPTVQAYVMSGWWVVNCVDITCLAVNVAEGVGGVQFPAVVCPDCGASADIIWPDPEEFDEINRLLGYRPHRVNRNWAPPFHRQAILSGHMAGQSVADLATENIEHGVRI